jgi:hypothetical protein
VTKNENTVMDGQLYPSYKGTEKIKNYVGEGGK